MTKDDVIRMAEAVGMHRDGDTWFSPSPDDYDVTTYDLEAFANLVAAAERESCAKVCEDASKPHDGEMHSDSQWAGLVLATTIRARGR